MPEKGIRFQRYVKYKAKCEANFGGGEKRIRFLPFDKAQDRPFGDAQEMSLIGAAVFVRGLPWPSAPGFPIGVGNDGRVRLLDARLRG